jgi:hypothetical protein
MTKFAKYLVSSLAAGLLLSLPLAQAAKPANPDQRPNLILLPDERDLVLQEMRSFLYVIQTIADALARDDMKAVADAARTMGSGAANEIPPHVVAKLPDDFKQLAGVVHTTFDTMALDAESLGDTKHTLSQLGGMLQTCNACHAMYQIPNNFSSPAPVRGKAGR